MIDLYELKQLIAFADMGTLAKVAEEFHISNPSITRSMKHLEESFGVTLFVRGKNHIELNDTGKLAVEYGRRLINEAEQMAANVRAFDQRQRTIVVRSCAPVPLWEILRKLSAAYPDMMVESDICQNAEVESTWRNGECDIAILPYDADEITEKLDGEYRSEQINKSNGKQISRFDEDSTEIKKDIKKSDFIGFMNEKLFVCVPLDHRLAESKTLTFADINGFNFLLRSELGFWDTMCRQKMPASKFLVQTDEYTFDELARSSSLPCFTTDYFRQSMDGYGNRVNIPLTDAEADVTFYLAVRSGIDRNKLIDMRCPAK